MADSVNPVTVVPRAVAGAVVTVATLPLRVVRDLSRLTEAMAVLASPKSPLAEIGALRGEIEKLNDPNGQLSRLDNLSHLDEVGASLDRLVHEDSPLHGLSDLSEKLDALISLDESLRQLGALGASLDRIALVADALDSLAQSTEDALPQLPAELAALRTEMDAVAQRLATLEPSLIQVSGTIDHLQESVDVLGEAVTPLSRIAGRLPGGRRRAAGDVAAVEGEIAGEADVVELPRPESSA